MTSSTSNTGGYRGALPPRNDRLARPWIFIVIAAFVLIIVLSFLNIPSRFIPEPTPVPLPSNVPSGSAEPSASATGSASAVPSASGSAAASPSATP
ncbi:MAG TPA: hypothetical protein VFW95_11350 [Candidatus Limnocylindria bacterium]|nr:hypothetical protein [Candidatus Limnocylindria bacterium]